MKSSIKILSLFLCLAFSLTNFYNASAITNATGNFQQTVTQYSNGSTDDPIYIYCGIDSNSMGLSASNGVGNFNYQWSKYNPVTNSFDAFFTDNNTQTSSINNISSGGYKVKISDLSNSVISCEISWVFASKVNHEISVNNNSCSDYNISLNTIIEDSFKYYYPPKETLIIDSNTSINVCIDAEHFIPSDLGFVLYGPTNCGSPAVTLAPHHNALAGCLGVTCPPPNFPGSQITNLCFNSASTNSFYICDAGFSNPTGEYAWYDDTYCSLGGGGYPTSTFSDFEGCLATDSGWAIQVFDGRNGTSGTLKNVDITISKQNGLCNPIVIEHKSGALNLPIDDNKFTTLTATKYTLPAYTQNITNEQDSFTVDFINSNLSINWTSDNPNVTINTPNSDTLKISNLPQEDTWFYVSSTNYFNCTYADSIFYQSLNQKIDSITIIPPSCFDSATGEILIHATWANQFSIDNGTSWQSSNEFNNITKGNFQIIALSSSGCSDDSLITVADPPKLIIDSYVTANPSCNNTCNGMIEINPNGGTPPYTHTWNINNSNINSQNNLCAGNYQITTSDVNGCIKDTSFILNEPEPLEIVTEIDSANCNGNNGKISLNYISGGTPPLTYVWNNGNSTNTLNNVNTGIYSVTVTDNNSCDSVFSNLEVISKQNLTVSINKMDTTLCYGANINLEAISSSGTAPYTYLWNNGSSNKTITSDSILANCYAVTVTDATGCTNQSEQTCVNLYEPITNSIDQLSLKICEGDSLTFTIEANGGNPSNPLNINWEGFSSNSFSPTIYPQGAFPDTNYYKAIVSDGGCSTNDTSYYEVSFYGAPEIDFSSDVTEGCAPLNVNFKHENEQSINCIWKIDSLTTLTGCSSTNFTFNKEGIFDVNLLVNFGGNCLISTTKENFITVKKSPELEFTIENQNLTLNDASTKLTNLTNRNNNTSWSIYDSQNNILVLEESSYSPTVDFSSFISNPSNNFALGTNNLLYDVELKATNSFGCSNSLTKQVSIDANHAIFIPTAFTPNADNINEEFLPHGFGILPNEDYEFKIFDRWGTLVFETNLSTEGWNGKTKNNKSAKMGVYAWSIQYKTIKGKLVYKSGYFNLLL